MTEHQVIDFRLQKLQNISKYERHKDIPYKIHN